MRLAGVLLDSMVAGVVTADALSSIETCIRSLGSRTRKTSVSTIFLGSLAERILHRRKQRLHGKLPPDTHPVGVARIGRHLRARARLQETRPDVEARVLPRSISKSAPNNGCLGTRASADAISCCSAAEGEHTFKHVHFDLRLLRGCCAAASEPKPRQTTTQEEFESPQGF